MAGSEDPGTDEPADAAEPVEPVEPVERDPDAAWREIVAHFGERARLDDEPAAVERPPADLGRLRRLFEPLDPTPSPAASGPEAAGRRDVEPDSDLAKPPGAPFVPPPAPPLPRPTGVRRAAWLGLFGAPTVLLVCLVLQIALPGLVTLALAGSFVGGFGYLVAMMPREPRDPGDDGARL